MKKIDLLAPICVFTLLLGGCTKNVERMLVEDSSETVSEIPEVQIDMSEFAEINQEKQDNSGLVAPTKEEVLSMRELVLEGMSEKEIDRLRENIKVANQQMEKAYLYDNIFAKLEDKESLYWNYFDNKGDIQISATETVYNRFNAENFISLLEEMKETVKNEELQSDLQQIIDQTALAAETHEMEYANNIYKLLHDMDYYLLRYGPEDVGKYTQDKSMVTKYYGVLKVYADASGVQEEGCIQ